MDNTVALVSAYLQVNGYFCVTEYPLLETSKIGDVRSVSDLDVLAFRFPGAGREVTTRKKGKLVGDTRFQVDPALGATVQLPDMIVGEVKRGKARFNPASRNPDVLAAALMRFGCCDPGHASALARALLFKGVATNSYGHRIRMVAFGGIEPEQTPAGWHVVSLERILQFLKQHLTENWNLLRQVHFSNDVLDLLSLLERARQQAAKTGKRQDKS